METSTMDTTDENIVEINLDTPLSMDVMSRPLAYLCFQTMSLAQYCRRHEVCTEERIDELLELSVELESSLLGRISELAENHGEYYMILGQVALDLCSTSMIDFQTFVDTVKMEITLDHMGDE